MKLWPIIAFILTICVCFGHGEESNGVEVISSTTIQEVLKTLKPGHIKLDHANPDIYQPETFVNNGEEQLVEFSTYTFVSPMSKFELNFLAHPKKFFISRRSSDDTRFIPMLEIDEDGDIFLRGKWIGYDKRLGACIRSDFFENK